MQDNTWWLQFFADGGGDGGSSSGGEGAAESGGTAADAAQQTGRQETLRDRLRKMGVPEEKLANRAYDRAVGGGTLPQQGEAQDAAVQDETEQQTKEPRKTLKQLLKEDKELNAEAQEMFSKRVSKFKAASDSLEALQPAIETLAAYYGYDTQDLDYSALTEAIQNDDTYYTQRAIDLGVSVDVARKLEQADRLEAARQRDAQMSEMDRQNREHFAHLMEQAAEMQKKYPAFDFQEEMEDPRFAQMMRPGSGLTVEDAYYAVHRAEIMEAQKRQTVQGVASTIQARQNRPNEGGARRGQAVPERDPNQIRHMTPERRAEIRRMVERGEKVTPDMLYG